MAASTTENCRLITGNLVKVILPSDDRKFNKIFLKIDSKFSQIGDDNEIIGLEIPRSRIKAEGISNVRSTSLDLNNDSESGTSKIFIQANAVQLNLGGHELIEIEVNVDDGSLLQIGDRCKIYMKDHSKAEGNNEVVGSSTESRRKLFVSRDDVMTGTEPITRTKQRKKKPANKTSNKRHPISKIRAAPLDSPECLKLDQMFFENVQKYLHPLRDNGKWSLFDEKWNEFFVKYGNDPIWKAFLKLEYGIRICYNSQYNSQYLEEAEKTLREGKKMIETLQNIHPSITQFFHGRFYCFLASVHRKTKLWGRAQEFITRAEQIFQNVNSSFLYDKATVFYENGSLYHEFDKRGVKEAKESFEKCYVICQQLKKEKGCDFIEKGQFAQLKKIMVLLGCSTQQGRKRRITNEDLEEAKKYMDEIDRENQERHSIPVSEQLQLLLAKSDSHFCMEDFSQAEKLALRAVDLADQHGFDSWPAKKRLTKIQDDKNIVKEQRPPQQNNNEENVKTVDQRVSCDADGSGSQKSIGNSDICLY